MLGEAAIFSTGWLAVVHNIAGERTPRTAVKTCNVKMTFYAAQKKKHHLELSRKLASEWTPLVWAIVCFFLIVLQDLLHKGRGCSKIE